MLTPSWVQVSLFKIARLLLVINVLFSAPAHPKMTEPAVDAQTLERAIIKEALWVLGLGKYPRLSRLVAPLFRPPVRRFARFAAAFENDVATVGFREAAGNGIDDFINEVDIIGERRLPKDGPLLLAANHPGTIDFLLTASLLPRDDLKIVASNVSIVRLLPATVDHFIFIASDSVVGDSYSRMGALRESLRHLRQGGALLTFPSGRLDPDPAVRPLEARDELANWSPSIALMLRKVPQCQVAATMVSGVLSEGWFRSPVTWYRKEPHYKQKVAELFQVMGQLFFPNRSKLSPRVAFGRPRCWAELSPDGDSAEVTAAIIEQAGALLPE